MIDHRNIRPAQRRMLIIALMTSTFMAAIEVTVISTVMPNIVGKLGGFDLFSWAFSLYLLAQGVMTPIFGRLADLFGRKRTYIGACLLFLIGSTLCGFAQTMPMLIAFRGLQGLGAGGLSPIASTIMADISAPKDRPRNVGWISSIYGVAAVAGPLAGAALVDFGWQWIFWMNIPFGILAIALVFMHLNETLPEHGHGVDLPGAALLLIGAGALMLLLTQHGTMSAGAIIGTLALALVALAALALQQSRAAAPLVPLHFYRNPMIMTGFGFGLSTGAYIIALTAFLPTYIQGVLGGTPLDGGLTLAYMMATWTVGSMAGGRVIARLPYRATALLGTCLLLLGALGPATLNPTQDPVWIRIGCVLIGIGVGLANITFTVAIQASVDWSDRGRATSLYFFSRILGQALGAAAFGGLLNAGMGLTGTGDDPVADLMNPAIRDSLPAPDRAGLVTLLDHALHNVYLATFAVAALVVLLALMLPRGARMQRG